MINDGRYQVLWKFEKLYSRETMLKEYRSLIKEVNNLKKTKSNSVYRHIWSVRSFTWLKPLCFEQVKKCCSFISVNWIQSNEKSFNCTTWTTPVRYSYLFFFFVWKGEKETWLKKSNCKNQHPKQKNLFL